MRFQFKVPSADQVRLAQLIGNKSEDPEINKKIKQVTFIRHLK